MGTVGNVLRTDTSYKGTGFLLGSNCNVFTIARDSNWHDIVTNRSPNPQGIFYICFENLHDGAKGIHMRAPLYVTDNIEGYNGRKPKIHSFSSIESEVSCFDSWSTRSASSVIMRYDSSYNRINLGRSLNGNGYSGTGFSALEAPRLYFDNLYALNGNYGKLLMRTDGWNMYNGVNWDWYGYNLLNPTIIGGSYNYSIQSQDTKEIFNNSDLDGIIDSINFFTKENVDTRSGSRKVERSLEIGISELKKHKNSSLFIRECEVQQEGTEGVKVVENIDMKSMLHLALLEIKKLKEEIQTIKVSF